MGNDNVTQFFTGVTQVPSCYTSISSFKSVTLSFTICTGPWVFHPPKVFHAGCLCMVYGVFFPSLEKNM